jgi:hypothetical protein
MDLKTGFVNQVGFEGKFKTWLIKRSLGQGDSYFWATRQAKRRMEEKLPSFSDGTIQLMLRSEVYELVNMVLRLAREKDVLFYAENGADTDRLSNCVQSDAFKKAIPILIKRDGKFSYQIREAIVAGYGNLRELYHLTAVTHPELMPGIAEHETCPLDIFLTVVKSYPTEIELGWKTIKRLKKEIHNKTIDLVQRQTKEETRELHTEDGIRQSV